MDIVREKCGNHAPLILRNFLEDGSGTIKQRTSFLNDDAGKQFNNLFASEGYLRSQIHGRIPKYKLTSLGERYCYSLNAGAGY